MRRIIRATQEESLLMATTTRVLLTTQLRWLSLLLSTHRFLFRESSQQQIFLIGPIKAVFRSLACTKRFFVFFCIVLQESYN